MGDVISIQLKWTYEPNNFLETKQHLEHNGIAIEIFDGCATASLAADTPNVDEIKEELTSRIDTILTAAQLMRPRKYKLIFGCRLDILEDSKQTYYLAVGGVLLSTSSSQVDLVIHNSDGGIQFDSKAERIKKEALLSEKLAVIDHTDPHLVSMRNSFNKLLGEHHNTFKLLYDMKEALNNKFRDRHLIIETLKISEADWRWIGEYANNQPLEESRHIGKFVGETRNATTEELEKARNVGSSLIQAYVEYLYSMTT